MTKPKLEDMEIVEPLGIISRVNMAAAVGNRVAPPKPQTKQEMSEWLAETVLGWEFCDECQLWVSDNIQAHEHTLYLFEYIYSPDGFFAVWDAVEKKHRYPNQIITTMMLTIYTDRVIDPDNGVIKDRYEAFYNAVYEAMGE